MPERAPERSARMGSVLDGKKSKPFHLVSFALRRGHLIFLLGALLSLLLTSVFLQWANPIYETNALLLLDPAKEPTLAGRERDAIPGNVGDYTRTLVNRLTGFDVMSEALARLPREDYPAFLRPDEPLERNAYRLMGRIKVREVPRTYLISLTISADQPRGLGPALNTVMQVFMEKIQQEQERQYARRLSYLMDEQSKILNRLRDERGELLALAEGMEQKAFLHETYSLHIGKQDMIQRLYWEAEAKHSEQRALRDKALADREALRGLDLQAFADERVADNFGINRIEQWTYEQLQSLRASIDGLTPENPDRIYVEERMRSMNAFLEGYKQQVNEETTRNIQEKQAYELDLEVIRAQSAYEAARDNAERLGSLLDGAVVEAAETSEAIYRASEILFSIEQLRGRLSALNNRIDDAEMEAKAPVRLEIDKKAKTPVLPARTNAKTLILMALVLGFGAVFGFVSAFDFLDDRLRDVDDLEKALGGPAPVRVPAMTHEELLTGSAAEAGLGQPRSPAMLAARSLAVRLEQERDRHGARVFALAGLNAECGTTSLVLNLAYALRFGCQRILVVECNLLRPGLGRLEPGLGAGPGMWELLSSGNPLGVQDVVQPEPRRRIDVITAGQPAGHPTLPDRAGLNVLLNSARQGYDMILLDAAPLLEDDFSAFAAIRADAVILVGREDVSLFRDLRRSIDLLVQAEVPAVSAVLNFVRPKRAERIRLVMERQMQHVSLLHRRLHGTFQRLLRRMAVKG